MANEDPPATYALRPILMIGSGGIVRAAHLPAYEKGGLTVAAIVDRDAEQAATTAAAWKIPWSGVSIAEARQHCPPDVIFDIAVPAHAILDVLAQLPDDAAVLIQKPMGETLAEAEAILKLCRSKRLIAAVNFQLRWAPNMVAARALADSGRLGKVHDMEVHVNVHTPWELWSFLKTAPRLEILYHSIHYIDLVRSWFGEPHRVFAKTVRNPATAELAATRSVIVLDYGDWVRAYIATSHSQRFSQRHQQSYVQWEGTKNGMRAQMGLNLDYPKGSADTLEVFDSTDSETANGPLFTGNWVPDAFLGSMLSLQRFVAGKSHALPTSVEDAINTMRVVEAAYRSSTIGGEPVPLA